MTDFFDPSFSIPVILGIVAVAFAGYALWSQKGDRSVSITTLDLVRNGITSQEEQHTRNQLELKMLNDLVRIALIFLAVVIAVFALFSVYALFVKPTVNKVEGPSSSN